MELFEGKFTLDDAVCARLYVAVCMSLLILLAMPGAITDGLLRLVEEVGGGKLMLT